MNVGGRNGNPGSGSVIGRTYLVIVWWCHVRKEEDILGGVVLGDCKCVTGKTGNVVAHGDGNGLRGVGGVSDDHAEGVVDVYAWESVANIARVWEGKGLGSSVWIDQEEAAKKLLGSESGSCVGHVDGLGHVETGWVGVEDACVR